VEFWLSALPDATNDSYRSQQVSVLGHLGDTTITWTNHSHICYLGHTADITSPKLMAHSHLPAWQSNTWTNDSFTFATWVTSITWSSAAI